MKKLKFEGMPGIIALTNALIKAGFKEDIQSLTFGEMVKLMNRVNKALEIASIEIEKERKK